MAIINANANGTRILLNSKSINTKSIMPKRVTVDLKKKGYFFCINNECALIKKRKRNERIALIFLKYFSKIKQTEAHKKFYLFHKKTSQVLKSVRFVKPKLGYLFFYCI